ncbi:glycosyltransferase family 4 protein [Chamaesiphon minutus]|uniref:Glycosyltransferase n=1 Tax=Chamaesiphon minutus (strain ATCC 27169 / PCC 6605) TaxID=1173020 RepID=K9ULA3_CHAP6|nr:glycosyltransferase family 1 protein [Chamaesiphon minutus]AFY95605.1 glycosyltransferase [Chamaesiphon minutus PCC 6605]
MKILYDISVLGIGQSNARYKTGIFRVVENLANGLEKAQEVELSLCSTFSLEYANATVDYLNERPCLASKPFLTPRWQQDSMNKVNSLMHRINQKQKISFSARVIRRSLFFFSNSINRSSKILIDEKKLVHEKKLADIDVFHSPFHAIPEQIRSFNNLKTILTVYDLIPLLYPQFFQYNEAELVKSALDSLRADSWVTCISQATKNDLCNYLDKLDPERVVVTHLAASELFYPCHDRRQILSVKQKYKIPDAPYILSLSTLEPRKNIDQTIRCFAKLVEQENIQDLCLVLVGNKGWKHDALFKELSKFSNLKDRIIVTGYVDDLDLAGLYSGAMAFVYPSFYEGFGLPPLEAMQCGVPVITSNTSSLPEVVEKAGIMVSPTDTDGLCQSMLNIYLSSVLREEMSFKSIEQAKKFSWQNCTNRTISTYKNAMHS